MPKAVKRGSPARHWADIARTQAWYRGLSLRSVRTNAQLDTLFAWRNEKDKQGKHPGRPKTFEKIMRNARNCQGRDPRWRSFHQILDVVDEHPEFEGTKRIYDAAIWDFFQETSPRLGDVRKRIDDILDSHRLMRVDPIDAYVDSTSVLQRDGEVALLQQSLLLTLEYIDELTALSLVWSLYLEAEPVSNHDVRAMLLTVVDKLLDDFFRQIMPDRPFDPYRKALATLQQTRLDLSGHEISSYGKSEADSRLAILPSDHVGVCTWENAGVLLMTMRTR